MKKLLFILIIGLFMSSCSRYTGISGGNGCGVWYPKKYTGTYKVQSNSYRYR